MATIIIIPSKSPIVLKSITSIMNSKLVDVSIEPITSRNETMIIAPRRETEVR